MYELNIFSPQNFVGQQCLMNANFGCDNYYIASNGELSFTLLQVTQYPINITAIGCYTNTTTPTYQKPYNPPSNQINMIVGSNYTFSVDCYDGNTLFSGKLGSLYEGTLAVNYTSTTTGFPNVAYGKIVVKVSKE